jgi:MinD superfamily P-loop ATPase
MKSGAGDVDLAIIDGSPGIGCPVIASLSGVDMVLIVAEPSVSGISDMERIIRTAAAFEVEAVVCVNKSDTNLSNTKKIEAFCAEHGLPFVGNIPFDPRAVEAINDGKTVVDIECISGTAVRSVYKETMKLLLEEEVN